MALQRGSTPESANGWHSPMARGTLIGLLLLACFGGWFAPYAPLDTRPERAAQAPSVDFWLGTDTLGRDVLSRVLHGGGLTLLLGGGAASVAVISGLMLGLGRGLGGNVVRNALSVVEVVLLSLPPWLVALVFVAGMGARWEAVILGVGVTQIAPFGRLVGVWSASVSRQPYVMAARAAGASRMYVALRVILPNMLPLVVGAACSTLSYCLLFSSGLTFLGLGGSLSSPEWGAMIAEGRAAIRYAPWIAIPPALLLIALVASLNAVGRWFSVRGWSSSAGIGR